MRTAQETGANARNQTMVSAALLAVLVASYFWVGAAVIRILADLPLVYRAASPFRF